MYSRTPTPSITHHVQYLILHVSQSSPSDTTIDWSNNNRSGYSEQNHSHLYRERSQLSSKQPGPNWIQTHRHAAAIHMYRHRKLYNRERERAGGMTQKFELNCKYFARCFALRCWTTDLVNPNGEFRFHFSENKLTPHSCFKRQLEFRLHRIAARSLNRPKGKPSHRPGPCRFSLNPRRLRSD